MMAMITIDYKDAEIIIQKIKEHVTNNSGIVSAAVVDCTGELVHFMRMSGAPIGTVSLAINKAYTAVRALLDTSELRNRDRNWQRQIGTYGDNRYTYIKGGVCIKIKKTAVSRITDESIIYGNKTEIIIGGIGVSGLSEDEDEKAALVGLNYYLKSKD